MKFATKLCYTTHLTLGMSLHYLGKLKIRIICRYSADMEENANGLYSSLGWHIRVWTQFIRLDSNSFSVSVNSHRAGNNYFSSELSAEIQ